MPAEVLAAARDDERQLALEALDRVAGRPPADHQVLSLLALVEGLRSELVRPGSTLTTGIAHEVMARQVAAVLDESTRPAA